MLLFPHDFEQGARWMKIGVAGAGAVGSHYGAMLQRAGQEVRLLARGAHLAAMRAHGLLHETNGERHRLAVQASDDPAVLEGCDVVMLTCKMPDLESMLARLAPHLAPHALLLTLQNGVDAPELVARVFPEHAVAAGTAFIGARIEAPGHVLHTAAGSIRAGIWQDAGMPDASSKLANLLAALNEAGVPAREERDVRRMLWRKLLWNCGFNALTAIVRRYARDVAAHPETRAIIEAAMRETIAVARTQGVALTEEDAEKHMAVTLAMGPVKTSMWQDVERGRSTEVDWINGAVVRRAEEAGLDAPVNRMLVALVHALEGRSEVRG